MTTPYRYKVGALFVAALLAVVVGAASCGSEAATTTVAAPSTTPAAPTTTQEASSTTAAPTTTQEAPTTTTASATTVTTPPTTEAASTTSQASPATDIATTNEDLFEVIMASGEVPTGSEVVDSVVNGDWAGVVVYSASDDQIFSVLLTRDGAGGWTVADAGQDLLTGDLLARGVPEDVAAFIACDT